MKKLTDGQIHDYYCAWLDRAWSVVRKGSWANAMVLAFRAGFRAAQRAEKAAKKGAK